jgi:peptidoglycan DL-endopeptidase CwlO
MSLRTLVAVPALLLATVIVPVTVAQNASADPTWSVQAQKVVKMARSQLGYHEHGNNCQKYGPCEEWCSLFATWVWRKTVDKIPSYAFTGDVYKWGGRHKTNYGKTNFKKHIRTGDALLFGTGPQNTSTSTHIGLVEKVSGNKVTLIEGNSGNKVARHTYTISTRTFYGGVHPTTAYPR